ncbi:MAG: 50S ribosomal protein L10 [Candidatus Woesearchaeota archaeon]|nr:50S ribosomal protein L10 [Candidatus Woesearchaeota archaeon]
MEAHVSDDKKKIVDELAKLILEYPIIGAVNVENLPTAQLQKMRGQMRGNVVLRIAKRRLIKLAIEKVKTEKKGIEALEQQLIGMPALLFTKDNPFSLFGNLKKNKSKAAAKPGQTAPADIVIEAGPTPFSPGPIISELTMAGLKTGVEGGKVAIKLEKVVVKKGQVIDAKMASLLSKFGKEPMEIGLDLVAAYENGIVFNKDVLNFDEEKFMIDVSEGARYAINLAIEIGFPTKETIEIMISKAYLESKALAAEQKIEVDAKPSEKKEKIEEAEETKKHEEVKEAKEEKIETKQEVKDEKTSDEVLKTEEVKDKDYKEKKDQKEVADIVEKLKKGEFDRSKKYA